MSQASEIKTTGQLRATLAATIAEVRKGDCDLDAARAVVKLASQINESFYSELKAKIVAREAGEQAAELGKLSII